METLSECVCKILQRESKIIKVRKRRKIFIFIQLSCNSELFTEAHLLPDTQATLIAIYRWKQLLLSTHSSRSKRLMASPMFFVLGLFKFSREHLSCFCDCVLIGMLGALANWSISGVRSRTERGENKEKKREGKWQTGPRWGGSQLPSR